MVVLNRKNGIVLKNNGLIIDLNDELFLFRHEDINKISILTTVRRLVNNTVFLVVDTVREVYLMGMDHPEFEYLVNDRLGRFYQLDYGKIIDAMQSKGVDKEYILYKKEG